MLDINPDPFEHYVNDDFFSILRISLLFSQDFEAVPYDKANYGKFHIGDSYIVLKVQKKRNVIASKQDTFFHVSTHACEVMMRRIPEKDFWACAKKVHLFSDHPARLPPDLGPALLVGVRDLPGRVRDRRHQVRGAGRLPQRDPGPAQGGPGPRVHALPELLQEG